MKKFIVFFLLLLLVFPLFAQKATLKGVVLDKKTGEKLIGVNVFLAKTNIGTSTDTKGLFILPNIKTGRYLLKVSCIGYQEYSQQIIIKENEIKNLTISLKESSQSLNEVVVTAKSEARKIREKAMPIAVISMDEIKGVNDINDVLEKVTGVKLRSSGGVGSSSRISVRGLEGKRIGFFIDEVPMNDNTDFVDLNDIPTEMIERIEIYKGIIPAKLGGSAIGGAVNIVMKDYPPTYVDISYIMASFNTHKVSTVFKSHKNDYELGFGGFYTYSDNNYTMELPLKKGTFIKRDHDKFNKYAIGGGFKAKNNKWWFDQVAIEYSYLKTEKEIQGIEYNIQEAKSFSNGLLLGLDIEHENFILEGLDLDFGLNFAHTIFKHQDKAKHRYQWDGTPYIAVSNLGGEIEIPNDSKNKKNVLVTKLNLNYLINDWSSINFNSTFFYTKGNPSDSLKDKALGHQTDFKSNMYSWVTGLNFETHFWDKKLTNSITAKHYQYSMKTKSAPPLNITTFKVKNINNFKNDWAFTEAIRYRFTSEFLAKASLAYDVRLPSDNELLGDGFLIRPSGDLKPERNTSANIGLMYDKRINNGLFSIEINAFYMYLKNMIRFEGGPLQSNYKNFGKMRTLGSEIEVKWDATSFLYLYANATYQDLRDVREYEPGSTVPNATKDDRMPNIPYLFANAGFEMHKENLFGGYGQNSRLFVDYSFVEEYFYDFEQSKFQEKRIPRATTIDAGIEYRFKNQRYIIGLQVNNLTDATVISEFNRPLPGRSFAVKLRYIFR